ncbi:unnamed protein product [Amoebophrya sp. A120]|nr:unnamed protein product [Amoebophrya sp. A120]|eukprot:GSA120T00019910001.1
MTMHVVDQDRNKGVNTSTGADSADPSSSTQERTATSPSPWKVLQEKYLDKRTAQEHGKNKGEFTLSDREIQFKYSNDLRHRYLIEFTVLIYTAALELATVSDLDMRTDPTVFLSPAEKNDDIPEMNNGNPSGMNDSSLVKMFFAHRMLPEKTFGGDIHFSTSTSASGRSTTRTSTREQQARGPSAARRSSRTSNGENQGSTSEEMTPPSSLSGNHWVMQQDWVDEITGRNEERRTRQAQGGTRRTSFRPEDTLRNEMEEDIKKELLRAGELPFVPYLLWKDEELSFPFGKGLLLDIFRTTELPAEQKLVGGGNVERKSKNQEGAPAQHDPASANSFLFDDGPTPDVFKEKNDLPPASSEDLPASSRQQSVSTVSTPEDVNIINQNNRKKHHFALWYRDWLKFAHRLDKLGDYTPEELHFNQDTQFRRSFVLKDAHQEFASKRHGWVSFKKMPTRLALILGRMLYLQYYFPLLVRYLWEALPVFFLKACRGFTDIFTDDYSLYAVLNNRSSKKERNREGDDWFPEDFEVDPVHLPGQGSEPPPDVRDLPPYYEAVLRTGLHSAQLDDLVKGHKLVNKDVIRHEFFYDRDNKFSTFLPALYLKAYLAVVHRMIIYARYENDELSRDEKDLLNWENGLGLRFRFPYKPATSSLSTGTEDEAGRDIVINSDYKFLQLRYHVWQHGIRLRNQHAFTKNFFDVLAEKLLPSYNSEFVTKLLLKEMTYIHTDYNIKGEIQKKLLVGIQYGLRDHRDNDTSLNAGIVLPTRESYDLIRDINWYWDKFRQRKNLVFSIADRITDPKTNWILFPAAQYGRDQDGVEKKRSLLLHSRPTQALENPMSEKVFYANYPIIPVKPTDKFASLLGYAETMEIAWQKRYIGSADIDTTSSDEDRSDHAREDDEDVDTSDRDSEEEMQRVHALPPDAREAHVDVSAKREEVLKSLLEYTKSNLHDFRHVLHGGKMKFLDFVGVFGEIADDLPADLRARRDRQRRNNYRPVPSFPFRPRLFGKFVLDVLYQAVLPKLAHLLELYNKPWKVRDDFVVEKNDLWWMFGESSSHDDAGSSTSSSREVERSGSTTSRPCSSTQESHTRATSGAIRSSRPTPASGTPSSSGAPNGSAALELIPPPPPGRPPRAAAAGNDNSAIGAQPPTSSSTRLCRSSSATMSTSQMQRLVASRRLTTRKQIQNRLREKIEAGIVFDDEPTEPTSHLSAAGQEPSYYTGTMTGQPPPPVVGASLLTSTASCTRQQPIHPPSVVLPPTGGVLVHGRINSKERELNLCNFVLDAVTRVFLPPKVQVVPLGRRTDRDDTGFSLLRNPRQQARRDVMRDTDEDRTLLTKAVLYEALKQQSEACGTNFLARHKDLEDLVYFTRRTTSQGRRVSGLFGRSSNPPANNVFTDVAIHVLQEWEIEEQRYLEGTGTTAAVAAGSEMLNFYPASQFQKSVFQLSSSLEEEKKARDEQEAAAAAANAMAHQEEIREQQTRRADEIVRSLKLTAKQKMRNLWRGAKGKVKKVFKKNSDTMSSNAIQALALHRAVAEELLAAAAGGRHHEQQPNFQEGGSKPSQQILEDYIQNQEPKPRDEDVKTSMQEPFSAKERSASRNGLSSLTLRDSMFEGTSKKEK